LARHYVYFKERNVYLMVKKYNEETKVYTCKVREVAKSNDLKEQEEIECT